MLILLAGCTAGGQSKPVAIQSEAWWKEAVFYEIFVRSFYDSDGDGVGDFNGIIAKLDYLNDGNPRTDEDLGITALWLMPIFPSPTYHGYDVTDYYAVNPQYGTMEDFKRLLAEAHRRGIHLIIDLVINHTSSSHPWFTEADSDPQSTYRDWYVWSDGQPKTGSQGWREGKHGYYYANFDTSMPDLNFHNSEVTAEINRITRFWLEEVGVDGFRIDAAKHLFEEGNIRENLPETFDWFQQYRLDYKAIKPNAFTIGEVYGAGALLVKKYSTAKLDMVFNFEVASGIMNSVKGGGVSGINSAIKFTQMDMPGWEFATFLTNHDQERVMSVLGASPEKAKVAAAILLTLPGTPFIYYGEEIGMMGKKPDEDIRRPMQWTGDAETAGFTNGTPWRQPDLENMTRHVEGETADSGSLLSTYRRLIALRSLYISSEKTGVELVESGNAGVYAVLRQSRQGALLIIVNLSGDAVRDYRLSWQGELLAEGNYRLRSIWDEKKTGQSLKVTAEGFNGFIPIDSLDANGIYIFVVQLK
jgi:glycosidase